MESEIREQPEVLSRNDYAAATAPLAGREYDMALLVARGSSDNAALFARYLLEVHAGIPVTLAAPSVITRFGADVRYPRTLAIGISQSGAAPDVAEVIAYMRAHGHTTVGITNNPGSRLSQEAEFTVDLGAGPELSIAATKTYTATLLALYELVRALAPILPPATLPTEAWTEIARESAAEATGYVLRNRSVFALGRGFGFGTALESALKLMECALIPAKPYSSADFEHGPKALAGPGSAAISYDGPKPHLAEYGCEIVEAPAADVPAESKPLWDAIFAQWLALLAARAQNLDPDDARHLNKITKTL